MTRTPEPPKLFVEPLLSYAGRILFADCLALAVTVLEVLLLALSPRGGPITVQLVVLVSATSVLCLAWYRVLTQQRCRILETAVQPPRRPLRNAFAREPFLIHRHQIVRTEIAPTRGPEWTNHVRVTLDNGLKVDLNRPAFGPVAYTYLLQVTTLGNEPRTSNAPIELQLTTARGVSISAVGVISFLAWLVFAGIVIVAVPVRAEPKSVIALAVVVVAALILISYNRMLRSAIRTKSGFSHHGK